MWFPKDYYNMTPLRYERRPKCSEFPARLKGSR